MAGRAFSDLYARQQLTSVMRGPVRRCYEGTMSSVVAKNHEFGCACHGNTMVGQTDVTVSACLERDHREIDAILNDVESLVRRGEPSGAEQLFGSFRGRLQRHIEAEEEILFPIYEQLSDNDGPTRVMLGSG